MKKHNLTIAYSPCPNDTYIFHAMIKGLVEDSHFSFSEHIEDVESLNIDALQGKFDVTKLSFHAYLKVKDAYSLCDSGSAMGFGCGPLLVTKGDCDISSDLKIAVPGKYTTALLLMQLWNPELKNIQIMRFDEIMPAVVNGDVDAGLVIHEGRFIYPSLGLKKIVDLGEWWENETKLPVPLGCIAVKRSLGEKIKEDVNDLIRASIEFAHINPEKSRSYIESYAQEMEQRVIDAHIRLYVNKYSLGLDETAKEAVSELEKRASMAGIE